MNLQKRMLTAAAVFAAAFLAPDTRALVSLQDGKDHIFVDGTLDVGYDSNVFANSQSGGSLVYQGSLGLEFARRAGWIGVNGSVALNFARYANFREQNYEDPKMTLELTKQTGRTTGSLTMSIQREDRADVTINTRDVSWNYDVGLNFQYPVIERYSFAGSLDYNRADYQDHPLFTNLTTYTGNLSLFYILNEQRDLFVNYRARYSAEATGSNSMDNALSGGVSGKVYGPFNGSLQVGYQSRVEQGGLDNGDRFNDVTASGAATWNINRRQTLTANLSRDYSTTATAISIESTSAELVFQDSLTAKAAFMLATTVGENDFLGTTGLLEPNGKHRVDKFLDVAASYFYTINQHIKFSLSYSYYRSESDLPFAEFPRSQLTFGAIFHW